jgi:hypothetical protein
LLGVIIRGKVPPLEAPNVDGNVLVMGKLGMGGITPPSNIVYVEVWVPPTPEVLMALLIVYH